MPILLALTLSLEGEGLASVWMSQMPTAREKKEKYVGLLEKKEK